MSKNKHMLPETALTVGVHRATAGAPSLVQGAYGARGNLELVSCDQTDGLWVFWFNSDLPTDPLATPDVPPGSWSDGLRFATGERYVDAQILQSTLGADADGRGHLEVLALTAEGVLQSWYWSPGPGFQRRVRDAAIGVGAFVATHDRGTLRITVRGSSPAGMRHLVSPARDYPSRTWLSSEAGPSLAVDATDDVAAAGVARDAILPGTARCAVSGRGGRTTELTWRDTGGGIRHLGIPAT